MMIEGFITEMMRVAIELNASSDLLSSAIDDLDHELQLIGLGIAGWVTIQTTKPYTYAFGYAKVGKVWGLQIRRTNNETGEEDIYAFNQSPRWLRNVSLAKLPELMDHLIHQGRDMKTKFDNRTQEVACLVAVIKGTRMAEDLTGAANRETETKKEG